MKRRFYRDRRERKRRQARRADFRKVKLIMSWPDPRLQWELRPAGLSTIPQIPSEPRRGKEISPGLRVVVTPFPVPDSKSKIFPDFDAQKAIFPRWYRLWLWVFPTRMKVEGDRYVEFKRIRGKIYVMDEGEVELLAGDG